MSELTRFPLTLKRTWLTPILSDAFAVILTVPDTVLPLEGELIFTDGLAVSLPETLFTLTWMELDDVLPAASFAVTIIVCDPFGTDAEFQEMVNGEMELLLARFPSTKRVTELTPTLSLAFTCMLIVPATEVPFVGDAILTEGAFRSLPPPPPVPGLFALIIFIKSSWLLLDKKSREMITGTLATLSGSSSITPDFKVVEFSVLISGSSLFSKSF